MQENLNNTPKIRRVGLQIRRNGLIFFADCKSLY